MLTAIEGITMKPDKKKKQNKRITLKSSRSIQYFFSAHKFLMRLKNSQSIIEKLFTNYYFLTMIKIRLQGFT